MTPRTPTRARTLVAFHAHPDDEALLTAGTMAKAAAEGHRVVLVLATDGALGLTDAAHREDLGARRLAEAQASAAALAGALSPERLLHPGRVGRALPALGTAVVAPGTGVEELRALADRLAAADAVIARSVP